MKPLSNFMTRSNYRRCAYRAITMKTPVSESSEVKRVVHCQNVETCARIICQCSTYLIVALRRERMSLYDQRHNVTRLNLVFQSESFLGSSQYINILGHHIREFDRKNTLSRSN